MKRIFKVICNGVVYGTYNTIEQARKLRTILHRRGKSEIVINISDKDIDPR
jgi:hypothetical protein